MLASLDSNNYPHKVGLGEREARIACSKLLYCSLGKIHRNEFVIQNS